MDAPDARPTPPPKDRDLAIAGGRIESAAATSIPRLALARWAEDSGPGESRAEAVRRILEWMDNDDPERDLNLSGLQLRSLPGVLPAGLRNLCADDNCLEALPGTLPTTLRYLSVENNRLAALPERLPSALKYLHAARNRLESLPRFPPSMFIIDIAHNRMVVLPDDLPDSLRHLHAGYNRVVHLPRSLPAGLEVLDVECNRLTGLPEQIDSLTGCEINLGGNPLSARIRRRLATATANNGSPGPRIMFSMADSAFDGRVEPLDSVVAAWCAEPSEAAGGRPAGVWRGFVSEPGAADFARFLTRLQQTVNSGQTAFDASVREWLEHLAISPRLRQKTFLLAAGASTSCEDRISLTFNDMKKARLVDDVENGRFDRRLGALLSLARGMFRLDLLEQLAREKAATLRYVDEVEVYLAFQVALRERLALPLDTPRMRFFDVSSVSEDDLVSAEARVKAREQSGFRQYLATRWGPWQAVLKRLDPTAYDAGQQQIAKEKDLLNERLQADLKRLTDSRPVAWPDAAQALRARFAEGETDIVSRIHQSMTLQLLAVNGLPATLLDSPWPD